MEMYEFEKHLAKNEMSIEIVNARRFGKAVHQAMELLECEAGIYRLTQEPYFLDLMAELEKMAARLMARNERWETMKDRDYCIWKAKTQRGLTDEQIAFFLEHHPRWDLLPYYACYVKKMGEQGALDEVVRQFG